MIYVMSDSANYSFPYVNRDVSWMYFNHRILQEAMRPEVPPLERLSFLGIYSNNLDEFFRVRMATTIPNRNRCRAKICRMSATRHASCFLKSQKSTAYSQKEYGKSIADVEKILADNNILILNETQLSEEQKTLCEMPVPRRNIRVHISAMA